MALVDSCDAAPATADMVEHRLGGFEPDAQGARFRGRNLASGRSGSMCDASKREGGMSSPHTIERQRGIKEAGQQLRVLRERWPLAFPVQAQDVRPLALGIAGRMPRIGIIDDEPPFGITSGRACATSATSRTRTLQSNTGLGKARSIDWPKPYADLGRFPAAGFHLHVARMSRGPAGCQREPLKMNGNQSQHDAT
jgi:hypothetical protein